MSDLSTRPPRRTLTVMEGREKNRPMVEGFARAAKQKGWGFYQLKSVNSDHIARFDFNGTSLDYVVYRELSRNNYHEAERLIYWLRQNHKVCININAAGGRVSTSDKHFQQGLFMLDPFIRQYALPTFEAKTKANVLAYVRSGRVRFPLILKPRRGTAGKGITLIRTVEDLAKIDSVKDLLIERYVEPECDWRVFVIGGTAVGIMRKIGDEDNPGDFRAWSAGRTKFLEDNPDTISTLSEIATRAAAVSRLEYAGVDIIREAKTGKYYILETNIAAGWSNHFIQVTHVDIPVLVLDWLENIDASRTRPPSISVRIYVEHRLQYLKWYPWYPSKIPVHFRQISSRTSLRRRLHL